MGRCIDVAACVSKKVLMAQFQRGVGKEELVYSETEKLNKIQSENLRFDGTFESGNLQAAKRIYTRSDKVQEYDLYLRPDIGVVGRDPHVQWFYFSVRNTRVGISYRFNIVNLQKPDSLYRRGLQPLMFSTKGSSAAEWVRVGSSIVYFENRYNGIGDFGPQVLTFTMSFDTPDDCCYLAYSYPYTYTDLRRYLDILKADEARNACLRLSLLCKTKHGNRCDMLTITSPCSRPQELLKKPVIVLTARAHPCETQSSFMIKGIIDYLTSSDSTAECLRQLFVFKIVPMLNPDGVIYGNSRSSLQGFDLNRSWRNPTLDTQAPVYYLKRMMQRLGEAHRKLELFCDFHGHSTLDSAFMYGCDNSHMVKMIPVILDRLNESFSMAKCRFDSQKGKENTGRVVVGQTFNLSKSFTLEASTMGGNGEPFAIESFEDIGSDFCTALAYFYGQAGVSLTRTSKRASLTGLLVPTVPDSSQRNQSPRKSKVKAADARVPEPTGPKDDSEVRAAEAVLSDLRQRIHIDKAKHVEVPQQPGQKIYWSDALDLVR